MRLNQNELDFDKRCPGIRRKIKVYISRELKNLKKIGFPEYDLNCTAAIFTKHIINILREGPE